MRHGHYATPEHARRAPPHPRWHGGSSRRRRTEGTRPAGRPATATGTAGPDPRGPRGRSRVRPGAGGSRPRTRRPPPAPPRYRRRRPHHAARPGTDDGTGEAGRHGPGRSHRDRAGTDGPARGRRAHDRVVLDRGTGRRNGSAPARTRAVDGRRAAPPGAVRGRSGSDPRGQASGPRPRETAAALLRQAAALVLSGETAPDGSSDRELDRRPRVDGGGGEGRTASGTTRTRGRGRNGGSRQPEPPQGAPESGSTGGRRERRGGGRGMSHPRPRLDELDFLRGAALLAGLPIAARWILHPRAHLFDATVAEQTPAGMLWWHLTETVCDETWIWLLAAVFGAGLAAARDSDPEWRRSHPGAHGNSDGSGSRSKPAPVARRRAAAPRAHGTAGDGRRRRHGVPAPQGRARGRGRRHRGEPRARGRAGTAPDVAAAAERGGSARQPRLQRLGDAHVRGRLRRARALVADARALEPDVPRTDAVAGRERDAARGVVVPPRSPPHVAAVEGGGAGGGRPHLQRGPRRSETRRAGSTTWS